MPTEAKEIFEANSRSFRELMSENGLGLYIPAYQRPYGWDRGKVEKLIDDALHGFTMLQHSDDSFTFLGSIITIHDTQYSTVHPIVRDEVPSKVLTVIDGQQRICSLLLFSIVLHNQIRTRHAKVFPAKKAELSGAEEWLNGQTLEILKTLGGCIFERQAYGSSPIYPRIIRAFDDQWSKKKEQAKYASPIANLIADYSRAAEEEKPRDFRPTPRTEAGEGETSLVKRYSEIRTVLRNIARAESSDSFEDMPSLVDIAENKQFQRSLLNHEFPSDAVQALKEPPTTEFAELVRLLMLGSYVLHRIALTVVKGKNENYAFTIFESLNTTGEPLTAFETFKPRVVSAEGLKDYEDSQSRVHVDKVADYLSRFSVGTQLQNATSDLLVSFALAETGYKLPKRLADQRSYLKDQYERHASSLDERVQFIRHLDETASFIENTWEPGKSGTPHLAGLPVDATTDSVKLCIAFLRKLNHSVVIAPIVRFYSDALRSASDRKAEAVHNLEGAIRAMTAFSVLWRTSRRTTGNIDREYRNIMGGIESRHMAPLVRRLPEGRSTATQPVIDLASLKLELLSRLANPKNGGIAEKDRWIAQSASLPTYRISATLARFVLLAAYHDTIEDARRHGLILAGKEQASPCFTFDGWRNESHLSIEHVAPQDDSSGWPEWFYADQETIHRIGNLVLAPADANSSLGNRPWKEKRVLYSALGAKSKEDAREILARASAEQLEFSQSTETLVEMSKHIPHLVALGGKTEEWDSDFLEARSRCLLSLAWDRMRPWLD